MKKYIKIIGSSLAVIAAIFYLMPVGAGAQTPHPAITSFTVSKVSATANAIVYKYDWTSENAASVFVPYINLPSGVMAVNADTGATIDGVSFELPAQGTLSIKYTNYKSTIGKVSFALDPQPRDFNNIEQYRKVVDVDVPGSTLSPVIMALSPASAAAWDLITIVGSNFTPTDNNISLESIVNVRPGYKQFGAKSADGRTIGFVVPTTLTQSSEITGTSTEVPISAGTYQVTVSNANGKSESAILKISDTKVIAGCYTFSTNLQLGSAGPDVSALQAFLISRGFSTTVTGYFGPSTMAALKAYQSSVQIPATGFLGPITRVSINNAGCSNVPTSKYFITAVTPNIAAPGMEVVVTGNFPTSTSNVVTLNDPTHDSGFSAITATDGKSVKFVVGDLSQISVGKYSLTVENTAGDRTNSMPFEIVETIAQASPVSVVSTAHPTGDGLEVEYAFKPRSVSRWDVTIACLPPVTASGRGGVNCGETIRLSNASDKLSIRFKNSSATSQPAGIKFKGYDAKGNLIGANSDAVTVPPSRRTSEPVITVTFPQAGVVLNNGYVGVKDSVAIAKIRWNTSMDIGRGNTIGIALTDEAGNTIKYIASGIANTGSYVWKYDSTIPSGKYQIEVYIDSVKGGYGKEGFSGVFELKSGTTPQVDPVNLSVSPSTPAQSTVVVDAGSPVNSIDKLPLLVFRLKSPSPAYLNNVTARFSLESNMPTAYLYQGSTLIDSRAVSGGVVTFSNIGSAIPAGAVVEYVIKADIRDVNTGSVNVSASVDAKDVVITDVKGVNIPVTGSAQGNYITVTNPDGLPPTTPVPVPANYPPTIIGINGPSSIRVGETGTWTIQATDPQLGILGYTVDWGDYVCSAGMRCAPQVLTQTQPSGTKTVTSRTASARPSIQSGVFTHAYTTSGKYMIKVQVTNAAGLTANAEVPVYIEASYAAPQFSLVGAPVVSKAINPSPLGDMTTIFTVLYNVKVKATGGDIIMGLPESSYPAFGTNSSYVQQFKNGAYDTAAPALSVTYAAPDTVSLSADRTSFIIPNGIEVTIPVYYRFVVKGQSASSYAIMLAGIGWGAANQPSEITPTNSPEWRSAYVVAVKPSKQTASVWEAIRQSMGLR